MLLFQTLIDFLIGAETKDQVEKGWNGEGTKIPFFKFPGLLARLLNMLEHNGSEEDLTKMVKTVEQIFPALDIIRRAGSPAESYEVVYKEVSAHLRSSFWQIRDLAARAMCALTPNNDWHLSVERLLALRDGSTNLEHGVLLAIGNTIERERNARIPPKHLSSKFLAKAPTLFFLC